MSTEGVPQVPEDSIDVAGVSITTATRTALTPRNGSVYNVNTFAAAIPVWFHRLHDGRYLALFKNRWHSAVSIYHDGPQVFSSHVEDVAPCYAFIDPTTGTVDGPHPWEGLDSLSSAVSRNDYLFALGIKDGVATVQHWVMTRYAGLQLQGTEVVPLGYGLGLWIEDVYLRVFGSNDNGRLASVKKNWGRIGIVEDPENQWMFEGAKGWYSQDYLNQAAPLPPGNLPTAGPVSMAKKNDRLYLVVTEHVANAYFARVYTTRPVDSAWKPLGVPSIPLGTDDTYTGGTVYLQPQLVTNGGYFAYVTSTKVINSDGQGILTTWGSLAV